jgi:flagellar motor switch protein FliM
MTGQLFALEERVVTLQFEIRLATAVSAFALALPMSFSSGLVRSHSESGQRNEAQANARLRFRERVLQCDMPLSVDLAELSIPLGDVVGLEAGSVLNLRTPLQTPILLRVGGHPIFEATPVRRGEYKAAQLNCALKGEV